MTTPLHPDVAYLASLRATHSQIEQYHEQTDKQVRLVLSTLERKLATQTTAHAKMALCLSFEGDLESLGTVMKDQQHRIREAILELAEVARMHSEIHTGEIREGALATIYEEEQRLHALIQKKQMIAEEIELTHMRLLASQ